MWRSRSSAHEASPTVAGLVIPKPYGTSDARRAARAAHAPRAGAAPPRARPERTQGRAAARLMAMVLRPPLLKSCAGALSAWRRSVLWEQQEQRLRLSSALLSMEDSVLKAAREAPVLTAAGHLAKVLRGVWAARRAAQLGSALERWRCRQACSAAWQTRQKALVAELQRLADEDAVVSVKLMQAAEAATEQARAWALRAANAALRRAAALKASQALGHWKAQVRSWANTAPAAIGSRSRGVRPSPVICRLSKRALAPWWLAWKRAKIAGRRQAAACGGLARQCRCLALRRVGGAFASWRTFRPTRSEYTQSDSAQVQNLSEAALASAPLASRADRLLRLKVRLAWHADFASRCSTASADPEGPGEELTALQRRLDRGSACLLEYVLASLWRARLRGAWNAMLEAAAGDGSDGSEAGLDVSLQEDVHENVVAQRGKRWSHRAPI
ncbi:unnamed protein product [Effrenium voratum]|nr:unnamed protein product [Effrenium voratum]